MQQPVYWRCLLAITAGPSQLFPGPGG
jgi:hypothetical protein